MMQRVYQIVTNPLISGSAIVVAGSFVANVFNFLFNFFMSRNLSLSEYGILASLTSLVVLATMPATAILPTIVKFAATYFANSELDRVKGLLYLTGKIMLFAGSIFFVIFIVFSEQIAQFFHIADSDLISVAGLAVFFGFIGLTIGAFLQGKLLFTYMTFVNFLGAFIKLVLGLLLVFIGFRVAGAVWAFSLSYIIPFFFAIFPLRSFFHKKTVITPMRIGELFSYGAPAAIALFSLTSLISTDIMLVKHFFSPVEAGKYAVLSLIGRVIFFLTASISTVMFPMVAQKFTKKENYTHIFLLSLILVLLPSVLLTICYFFMPNFIVSVFSSDPKTAAISSYLGIFAIYISIYSILYVITNFYLSINKTKVAIPIAFGALLQIVLLWMFHDSLLSVIYISLSIVSLLLIVLLLYYPYATKK